MSKISIYTGRKYKQMKNNYMAIVTHQASVPNPYQYKYMKLNGAQFKYDRFSYRLGLYMTTLDLEVSEFCDMCNMNAKNSGIKITPSCIWSYLYGKCVPRADNLKLIARTMGVHEDNLTGWTADSSAIAMSAPSLVFAKRNGDAA